MPSVSTAAGPQRGSRILNKVLILHFVGTQSNPRRAFGKRFAEKLCLGIYNVDSLNLYFPGDAGNIIETPPFTSFEALAWRELLRCVKQCYHCVV